MKDIKDFLNLYLGCECVTEDGRRGWFSGFDVVEKDYSITMITVRFDGDDDDYTVLNDNEECDRIKPLLRPLSDMTEAESDEASTLYFNFMKSQTPGTQDITMMAHMTKWFLSKGFDLYGLIEAGLAIDKTTVNA